MARYSLGVKQSCTSKPSTSSRETWARSRASSTAARTWGSTYGSSAERARVGVVAQIRVADQNNAGTAVGHLAAVEAAQPALDDGVRVIVVGQRIRHGPCARLRVGIVSRVGEIHGGDGPQMRVVDAVAPVVFVDDSAEHVRPHE